MLTSTAAHVFLHRGPALPDSLSVLLPVHNAQSELPALMADLLEVLPELTSRFDVLVLDRGSTDATWETACELSGRYPQVRCARQPSGGRVMLRQAASRSRADLILIRDEDCRLELRDLHKLWAVRRGFDAVLARAATFAQSDWGSWAHRVRFWRLRSQRGLFEVPQQPGYQLLRRTAVESAGQALCGRRELLAELSRGGFAWQEVEVRLARRPAGAAETDSRLRVDHRASTFRRPSAPSKQLTWN
jgi:glycosyltransferase involved in cell wall biosynthesis